MNAGDLLTLGLGLSEPWRVVVQSLDLEKKPSELRLEIEAARGERYPCPVCAESCKAHDFTELSWRRPSARRFNGLVRFVPKKTQEQADIQAIHRVRKGLVQARTATINQVRGLLAENGIIIKQGACHLRSQLPIHHTDLENELSGVMRRLLAALHESITFLDGQIAEQNATL